MRNLFVYEKTTFEHSEGDLKNGFKLSETNGYIVHNHEFEPQGIKLVVFRRDGKSKWLVAELTTGYLASRISKTTRDGTCLAVMSHIKENVPTTQTFHDAIKSKLEEINLFKSQQAKDNK